MPRLPTMSAAVARRTILAAQGLAAPRPSGRIDRRHLRKVIGRLGLIQIDSVNVLERAHYLPLFSRLGPYDAGLLDRLAYEDNELFEYWGHVASLIDVEHEPNLRWRMQQGHQWSGPQSLAERRPDLVDALEREVIQRGAVTAGELREHFGHRPTGEAWWGWDDTKQGLEVLFGQGRVGAIRRGNFERVYCSPGLAVPAHIRARPTPSPEEAKRALLLAAARAHGVATAGDLADYWRLKTREARPLLQALAAEGSLEMVQVEGWNEPAYRHPEARTPRRVEARALVNPFDVAMWERSRVERVHRFDYTIEIYVPAPKRVFGYYVLPFLLGDTYVGRVDLKADRKHRRLLVQAAHAETDLTHRGVADHEVADTLADELRLLAEWLDLDDITVGQRGGLSPALSSALA